MRAVVLAMVAWALGLLPAVQSVVSAQEMDAIRPVEFMRRISVSGTGEVRAAPDAGFVTLGVRNRAKEAQRASRENAEAMGRVMQAIRGLGIVEKDIETVQYTLQPAFEYPSNAPPRQVGYEATNLVKVTVRDLDKVGQVIDAAAEAGANVVQDVAFGLRDESSARVRSEALTKAVADGRAKADVMAKALDVKLGTLMSAGESTPPIVGPMYARAAAEAAPATPISPQQIVVRATVSLVYIIQ